MDENISARILPRDFQAKGLGMEERQNAKRCWQVHQRFGLQPINVRPARTIAASQSDDRKGLSTAQASPISHARCGASRFKSQIVRTHWYGSRLRNVGQILSLSGADVSEAQRDVAASA